MINKAIAKITDEMMKINHPFVNFIEERLTSICTNEKVAGKLLDEGKTLKEFLDKQEAEMKKIAQKNGTGHQSAGLSDAEFYARAEEYYGITDDDKQMKRSAQRYMETSREYSEYRTEENLKGLSYTKALILMKIPKANRGTCFKNNDGSILTVKEFKKRIKRVI